MIDKKSSLKNPMTKFVVRCYLWFWAGLVVTLIVAMLAGMTSPAVTVCSTLTSWTPTVVLFATFKILLPDQNPKEWLKARFSAKINPLLLIITFVATAAIAFGAFFITEGLNSERLNTVTPIAVLMTAFSTIITGALGEELGWRGYLQPAMEEKNGGNVVKSALIVGVIWSFWHTPLWFVTLGFPMNILPFYILGFIAANISFSVIIAVCYSRCRNMVIPMWIHFSFNFVSNIIIGGYNLTTPGPDLVTEQGRMVLWFCVMSVFSVLLAVCAALWHIGTKKKNNGKLAHARL